MTPPTRTPDGLRPPVVLAGGSQFVRDQVARACAAAGVTPHLVDGVAEALALDPVVLIVADLTIDGLPGVRDVIVVGSAEEEHRVWGVASSLASSSVVVLPQGAGWLAECIGRRLNPDATGSVVGVLGAVGGCGASTLAYWCARSAAERGQAVVLIDGQPLGGGIEVALGLEGHPGVRWDDLADIRGTLSADQFATALPSDRGVAVLSHAAPTPSGGGGGADVMRTSGAVLDASRGGFELSLIDLGHAAGADRALASACDHLLLVVPARPRSVAAAAAVLRMYGSTSTTIVLRGPVSDGLDAWLVADLLGRTGPLPCLPSVRGAARTEATGRLADLPVPRPVRRMIGEIESSWERSR